MNNIYLVGFMGTGKTCVARELAHRQKRRFIDLDELIELRQKMAIAEIFAKEGEPFFRRLEKRTLQEVAKEKKFIVSCGGGIVMDKDNLKIMQASGKVICLQATPAVILKRTCQNTGRPLLNVPQPKERVELLLKMRAPYYALADKSIDTSKLTVEEVTERVIAALKLPGRKPAAKKIKRGLKKAALLLLILFSLGINSLAENEKEEAFEKGNEYYRNKMYDQAIEEYSKAISINLEFANLYYNRGLAYYRSGEPDKAIADFDRAISIDPAYAACYSNRGFIYYKKGDFDQALEDFAKAIEVDPDYPRAYYNRGAVNFKLGNFSEAAADYTSAITRNPENPLFYYNRSVVYYSQQEYIKAILDAEKSLQLNPKNALAYMNLGNAYFKQGFFDQAGDAYDQAIKINPELSEVLINRGICNLEREKPAVAIADYDSAIKKDPENSKAYYCRAYAYFLQQDFPKAWEDLGKAQELKYKADPDFLKELKKASGKEDNND